MIRLNQKNANVVSPKITEVAARLESNSAAISVKKAPKLYAVPRVTNDEKNVPTTTNQARRESTPCTGSTVVVGPVATRSRRPQRTPVWREAGRVVVAIRPWE